MTQPEPMTPPDCDLRGYEYMPLLGVRLYGSAFYSLALQNPRAGLAAQKLWWEAWQQCPAGSLPSDEFTLCRLADFGTDLKAWAKARDIAMHGFVLCSDGRYYHPLICEQAVHAYQKRSKGRERKARWRAGKDAVGNSQSQHCPAGQNAGRDGDGTVAERAYRTVQDRIGTGEDKNPPKPPLEGGARRRRNRSEPKIVNGFYGITTLDEEDGHVATH